jgi:hypothetical protein
LLTCREALELAIYDQRFPIDDQSNFQVPSANLAAIYVNSKSHDSYPLSDFMPFYEFPEEPAADLDEKMRAMLDRMPKE